MFNFNGLSSLGNGSCNGIISLIVAIVVLEFLASLLNGENNCGC